MEWKEVNENSLKIWLPQTVNEELVGDVTEVINGEFGKQIKVKKENGEEVVTPSHAYLRNRIKEVKVGSKVKIIFVGEKPNENPEHSPSKLYKVYTA